MAIKSRFAAPGEDVFAKHVLPPELLDLFNKAPAFGSIFERRHFFNNILPTIEAARAEWDGEIFSIRPSWTNYFNSPRHHIVVIGHVLFCHTNPDVGWYYQRSTHLFDETPVTRMQQTRLLLVRARRFIQRK